MTLERKGLIQFGGEEQTVVGPDLKPGESAPPFRALANDWSPVDPITDFSGKVRVLLALPSLETSVCDTETRRFNEAAAALGDEVLIFAISHDLPYTQKRWCGAAGVDQVATLSDHTLGEFGPRYGALIKEKRVLRRAVFVVDRQGTLTYAAYMPALGIEPDYEAVLAAARAAL